jgi:hypothetical protein
MMIHDRKDDAESDDDSAHANGEGERFGSLAALFSADFARLRHSLRRLAVVESRRLHMQAIDAFFAVYIYGSAFVALLTAAIVASIMLIVGLRLLFSRWMGGGIPELLAGACVLTITLGAAFVLRAWLRRRIVRSTARRLAVLGATSDAAPSPSSATAAAEGHG